MYVHQFLVNYGLILKIIFLFDAYVTVFLPQEVETNSFESNSKADEGGISQLLLHVRREDKMWEKLPKTCSTVLELHMCAVRSDWRGKGIMTALCKETE